MNKEDKDALRKSLTSVYGQTPSIYCLGRLEDELAAFDGYHAEEKLLLLEELRIRAEEESCGIEAVSTDSAGLIHWLSGASQLNPLPPHWYCPICGRFELAPGVKDGFDLPVKTCCGQPMKRDGHAIPVEAFQNALEHGGLTFRLPEAFVPTAVSVLDDYFDVHEMARVVRVPSNWHEGAVELAVIPDTERMPTLDAQGVWQVDPDKLYKCGYKTVHLLCSEVKDGIREKRIETGRVPTLDELLSESVLAAVEEKIKARLLEDGRPLLRSENLCFSRLFALHGYERSGYADENPVFSLPDATYADFFTCREDVWYQLKRAKGADGLGTALAKKIVNLTRRGRYACTGIDQETERILQEAEVPECWITQMRYTLYLPPKADVIHTLMDQLELAWYELLEP